MKLSVSSIKKRLRKLEQYIGELEKHQVLTLDEFKSNFTVQLAVERAFQAAVESCADIASHIVSVYNLGQPQEQRDLFRFLSQAGCLETDFANEMSSMVSFHNRIVHLYWDLDLERLYQHLQTDVNLLRQFRDFTLALLAAEEKNLEDS